jgi:hypothetical protein
MKLEVFAIGIVRTFGIASFRISSAGLASSLPTLAS